MAIIRKNSVAKKNVIVLILSLLPFVVGISYSIYKSSDKDYLSKAINIAGSQRMRTILIANYSHQMYSEDFKLNRKEFPLINELRIYKEYLEALKYGDASLGIKPNNFKEIKKELEDLTPLVDDYIEKANDLILNPDRRGNIRIILMDSLRVKNGFHEITELYQLQNDLYIKTQKTIDGIMIFLAVVITIGGLFLTNKIKQQEYHANFDSLTKLKNRHSLFTYIKDKPSNNYSTYFIDLNKFKVINDTYGHETGDEILIGVSERLRKVFGRETLFRYGGDEFIALAEDPSEVGAADINAEIDKTITDIKTLLLEPIVDSYGREHFMELAMGVVSSNVSINSWDVLINLADDLMYESKSIPTNIVILRNKKEMNRHVNFLKDIDNIFSKGSIKLHYQPIYIATKELSKISFITSRLEKNGEEFYAKEFLHVLKRKGCLTDLDKNTLRILDSNYSDERIEDSLVNSEKRYIISLFEDTLINVGSNGFLSLIKSLDIPRNKIIIKIQEHFLNNNKVKESLAMLKLMNFTLAIDDFTLDLSLKDFHKYEDIDFFKIDNSLVSSMFLHENSVKILKEFVSMLIKNDKFVIVEGISRKKMIFLLKDLSEQDMGTVLYTNK